MNPGAIRLLMVAGGVAGVLAVGWWGYSRFYAGPASELRASISELKLNKSSYDAALLEEGRIKRELGAIIGIAVHGDRESLEHRLRVASTTLAFQSGLTRLEVNSLPPTGLGNPAGRARGVRDRSFQRDLRDRIDASEARVQVSGEGPLDAVMTALATAEAQRWTLGVESWTVKPVRVAEGKPAVFSLSMTMSVLVVNDDGALSGEIPIDPLSDRVLAQVGSVVGADPFRTAPKPVVAVAPPAPVVASPPPPPPPPPPAGAGWKLVGVLQGESGRYVIVVHQSGNRRTLLPGDEVGGLRLASVLEGVATFEANEERFEVRNGELLAAGRGRDRR